MKIVVVSENTYPTQGPRAFRTAELTEELARRGHEVTLFVRSNEYDYSEYTKTTNIKVKKIPTIFFLRNGQKYRNLIRRILIKLLNKRLEFPSIELVYKIPKTLKKESKIDFIISIAYPHTIHMGIDRAIRKKAISQPKCWIADCGDPFMLNPMYNPPRFFEKFEKSWCTSVDVITVPTRESKEGYYPEFHNKVYDIPQGFKFEKTPIDKYVKNSIPTFIYAGTFYEGSRDPYRFLDFLSTLDMNFRFIIYTKSCIPEKYLVALGDKIKLISDKGRAEIIKASSKADFLINIQNNTVIQTPSKLIDYGIAGRPILNISTDFKEQKEFIEFLNGDYSARFLIPSLENYKIENIADKFIQLLGKNSTHS